MYTTILKQPVAGFFLTVRRRRNSLLGLLAISFAAWSASAAAETVLRLYTYPQGTYGQVAGVTLQKLIAKNSKSLRIESLPAAGREQYADYADASPEKRKLMILQMTQFEPVLGEKGQIPWAKPVPRMKALMTYAPNSAVSLYTNDPSVKTIYDLAGKKVDLGLPGSQGHNSLAPLFTAAGLMQKIQLLPSVSTNQGWQRLGDKVVDATNTGIINMRLLPPGPSDILKKNKIYQVHVPQELFKKAQDTTGLPLLPLPVKKGAFKESYALDYEVAREDSGTLAVAYTPGFWVSADMPDEIAYEITKTALKNIDQFGNDHALGKLLKEQIGHMTVPQAEFHPGARRAYQELGFSYGLEGIKAHTKQ